MKVKFLNHNGAIKSVQDNTAIVEWMIRNDYIEQYVLPFEFMRLYAERKQLFDNIHLRFNNIDAFVKDLIANGIITVKSEA